MDKIGLVDEGKYKAFYSARGKCLWKDYGKKYEWKYIFPMLIVFWPVSVYYGVNKDKYMRAMTGNINWAGGMKYVHILATWFFSVFMTALWMWIICIIFNIK